MQEYELNDWKRLSQREIIYIRLAIWQKTRTYPSINFFRIYCKAGQAKNFPNSN